MDSIRVSEAPDPSSILGEATAPEKLEQHVLLSGFFIPQTFAFIRLTKSSCPDPSMDSYAPFLKGFICVQQSCPGSISCRYDYLRSLCLLKNQGSGNTIWGDIATKY